MTPAQLIFRRFDEFRAVIVWVRQNIRQFYARPIAHDFREILWRVQNRFSQYGRLYFCFHVNLELMVKTSAARTAHRFIHQCAIPGGNLSAKFVKNI